MGVVWGCVGGWLCAINQKSWIHHCGQKKNGIANSESERESTRAREIERERERDSERERERILMEKR